MEQTKLAQLAQTRIEAYRQSLINHNELNEIKEYILNWASKGQEEWFFYNDLRPYISYLEKQGFQVENQSDVSERRYKVIINRNVI